MTRRVWTRRPAAGRALRICAGGLALGLGMAALWTGGAFVPPGAFLLFVAGALLVGPLGFFETLFSRSVPWRSDGKYADCPLDFKLESSDMEPHRMVEQLDNDPTFALGTVDLVMWVVVSDDDGDPWTIAQERRDPSQPHLRESWTASIDSPLDIADLDETGRLDPIRAAHRLARQDLGAHLRNVSVVGWGVEGEHDGSRVVVLAIGETHMTADRFGRTGGDAATDLHHHRLDDAGVTSALTSGHPVRWQGSALFGLLELFEAHQPGGWARIERAVARKWHEQGLFERIEVGFFDRIPAQTS